MNWILEKMEGLFVVNRKEPTYKKGFLSLVLVLIIGFTLPVYFKYEDYTYAKYKEEYNYVAEIVKTYKVENGTYPLGDLIDWNKEKNLNMFFTEKNFSKNGEFRYLDTNLLSELKNKKYTYIINVGSGSIYTSEFVAYKFSRWHFVFY